MDLNYAMSYRITTLEIEQAAVRAERARVAAEHGEQIVRTEGFVRRTLRGLSRRRAVRHARAREAASARPAALVAPEPEPARVAPEPARIAAASAPAPVASETAAPTPAPEPAIDSTRADELVGCASHAA